MSTFLRHATRTVSGVRAFSSTTIARKDIVQDLYLREIKAYKPTPVAKDAHVGVVKAFSLPPKPTPPTLPADLAADLSAYDAAEVTLAPVAEATSSTDEAANGADAYLSFLEQDLPKPEAHHH